MKKLQLIIVGLGLIGLGVGCASSKGDLQEIAYEGTSSDSTIIPKESSGTISEGTADSGDEVIVPTGPVVGAEEYAAAPVVPAAPADTVIPPPSVEPVGDPIVVDGDDVTPDIGTPPLPPAVSCDEPAFAFVSNRDGNDDVYFSRRSSVSPVTRNETRLRQFQEISVRPGTSEFAVEEGVLAGIIPVFRVGFGSEGTDLSYLPLTDGFTRSFAWNADGSKAAYLYEKAAGGGRWTAQLRVVSNFVTILEIPLEGPRAALTFDSLAWAGDHQIVYSIKDTHGDSYVYSVSWDEATRENIRSLPIGYPSVGHEGTRPEGTRLDGMEPATGPDGKKIAFAQLQDGVRQIALCDLPLFDGASYPYSTKCESVRTLTRTGNNTSPSFSPDGRWIYFVSDRDGNQEIYRIRPDGTGEVRLTNNPADDKFPAPLSPDAGCE